MLDALFGPFDLDVAAAAWNAKCRRYFDALANGLEQRWRGRVWCNPPYSEVALWIAKAIVEVLAGHAERVCFLVASRTGTRWWRAAMAHDPWRSFLPGRLRFYGPDGLGRHPAAFDSAVVVLGVPSTFPAVLPPPWRA